MSPKQAETLLRSILRLFGTASLSALIFVVAPRSTMDSIHQALGMGPLPDGPIFGYLARSTSALYALVGGLFWVVSFDLAGSRRILHYLGVAIMAFGVALLFVDLTEGLPRFWSWWEGPVVFFLGTTILLATRRASRGWISD